MSEKLSKPPCREDGAIWSLLPLRDTATDGEHFPTDMGRLIAALVVACFGLLVIAAPNAFGAQQVITSAGSLPNIYLSDDTACQADHVGDALHEFSPSTNTHGDCGTFLSVDAPYGPDGERNLSPHVPYTLVSQSAVTGFGLPADPFQVVTVVDAGNTGLRITQTDSYAIVDDFYRTDIVVSNSTGTAKTAALYHAADCFLQDDAQGFGFGFFDSAGGGIYCSSNANNTPPGRIEGFVPLSSGSNYVETDWPTIWNIINGTQFPNTCACATFQDNAAGLSWPITVPANGSVTRSLLTSFSPTGEPPPPDGIGTASARGIDPDATTSGGVSTPAVVAAKFSAITNCDETQSTRPFYVRWTVGSTTRTFKKTGAASTSTCTNTGGTNTNAGSGTGTINGSTAATVDWSFSDGGGPDDVQITVDPDAGPTLDIAATPPAALSGTPGGVWVFGELPWPG